MISIVLVYNNERVLNEILLESLKNQTAKFEIITIDNTKGQFKSAAEALNYGAKKARGKYIMFIHSDVELASNKWLEDTEKLLDGLLDLGIAGIAGMKDGEKKTFKERKAGYISDCGHMWGKPFQEPVEVQTLDELLLIMPKSIFNKIQFDEKIFDGWHCYGADYCLSVKQKGLKAYVIPAFVYHRSLMTNVGQLLEYQQRLYDKHKRNYKHIYMTCGEISWHRLKIRHVSGFFAPFYKKLFPSWIDYLKKELSNNDTVLDLGCGYNSPIQHCNVSFSTGVELFEPYLQESRKKSIHKEYIKADVRKVEFKPKSFDVILCLEVLEHLTKKEGCELIEKMEKWAKKEIIITTPNGYLYQDGYDNNLLQEHKSGWSVDELKNLGFKTYGMNGWKRLREYKGGIKYKPTAFWQRVSDLSQKVTYYYPKLAFQLFAVKQIQKNEFFSQNTV